MVTIPVHILRDSYYLHLLDLNSVMSLADFSIDEDLWNNHYGENMLGNLGMNLQQERNSKGIAIVQSSIEMVLQGSNVSGDGTLVLGH